MKRGRPSKKSRSKRKRTLSAPPVLVSPKKRLKWTNESMLAAIKAVQNGSSVSMAAVCHNVPRMTLQDRLSGRVVHGTKPGPVRYLNKDEEANLAEFLEVVSDVGYGKTKKQIKNMVESAARDKGVLRKGRISDGWFRGFMERQPQLRLRKGDKTSFVRMDAMKQKEELDNYFITLKSILVEHNLMNKPELIYNVDESGMPLEQQSPRVVARKGKKKVRYCTSGNKSQITIVGCINAIGQAMPPFIIYDAKNLNMDWTKEEVPGTTYGLSDNGWIDMELFKQWFQRHFLRHAGASRPLLLLLDGHSSHYNIEAISLARENGVIIFTLVPHTTHELQPLDTAVFGPLKKNWYEECHMYVQSHPGRIITKYHFNEVFSKAWLKSMMPANIISGFKTCGIYPFNPRAVLDHDPTSENSEEDDSVPMADKISLHSTKETTPATNFTAEENILFTRRYENGYDIPDPRYVQWMEQNHPEDRLLDLFPDATPLEPLSLERNDLLSHAETTRETAAIPGSTQSNGTSEILSGLTVSNDTSGTLSISPTREATAIPSSTVRNDTSGAFSDSTVSNDTSGTLSTTPAREAAAISGSTESNDTSETLSGSAVSNDIPETLYTPTRVMTALSDSTLSNDTLGTLSTPTVGGEPAITINPPESEPHQLSCTVTNSTVTPGLTPSRRESVCRNAHSSSSPSPITDAISKYLVQYVPPPPVKKNTAASRVTGSRVLTSAEGYAILQGKEEKKRKEKEEKDRRKQEREEKKREKQEAFRKKAEEKAKKSLQSTAQRTRRKGRTRTTNASTITMPSSISHDGMTCDLPSENTESEPAASTTTPHQDSSEGYECCECLGTYEEDVRMGNGAEWAKCVCSRWIHVDCISKTEIDEAGEERICSNCVV